jgi:hypothetical protein
MNEGLVLADMKICLGFASANQPFYHIEAPETRSNSDLGGIQLTCRMGPG